MIKRLISYVKELRCGNNEEPLEGIKQRWSMNILHFRKIVWEKRNNKNKQLGGQWCVCSSDSGQKRPSGKKSPSDSSDDRSQEQMGPGEVK